MYINKTTTIKGYNMKETAKPFTEEEYKPIIEAFGGKYNATIELLEEYEEITQEDLKDYMFSYIY